MLELFQTVFYQPIFNLLIFLYNTVSLQDFGVAIILLTAIVKLVLWPLSRKSIKSQKALQDLQPKINELKAKYKGNQQAMGKELMELYKKYKVNPFSSCLPLLVQFPVFIAIYRIFREDLNKHLDLVYSFLYRPEIINTSLLGLMDLSKPSIYLAVMAGAAQFWQAKMMMAKKSNNAVSIPGEKKEGMAEIMNKQMLYFMPAITIFIGVTLPGGLTLYWLVLTLLTVLQQSLVVKKQEKTPIIEGEVIE
ncbi:MAG: YidC/Oxa1 family membrane protein insertase [Patescibacteria group bacterium]|nr:YidC/Oxa1 family membrane protein insertase [Patescibacteria group bacterium]